MTGWVGVVVGSEKYISRASRTPSGSLFVGDSEAWCDDVPGTDFPVKQVWRQVWLRKAPCTGELADRWSEAFPIETDSPENTSIGTESGSLDGSESAVRLVHG